MSKRTYSSVKVYSKVRCMSDGHHWFSVKLDYTSGGYLTREYSPGYGFDGLGYALGWTAPAYVEAMVKHEIGQMCRDNVFNVYECDRDGNKRRDDLRYHNADVFKWYAENYK